MVEALQAGQTDPGKLADLARGRLKATRGQREEALVGTVKPHHRFMRSEHLVLIETFDEAIGRVSQEIAPRLDPPPDPLAREPELQAERSQEGEAPESHPESKPEQER